jgi:hypothetical protein
MVLNRKVLKFEIDLDFVLIAVTTSLKDYRICYYINKCLNFNFTRIDDLALDSHVNGAPMLFSLYHYVWESTETDFYFIMIKNYIDDDDLENMISALNKIPEIVAAVKIDPKKIKSRENLLF